MEYIKPAVRDGGREILNRKVCEDYTKLVEKGKMVASVWPYVLATALGLCAGILDVKIGDLLLTALIVLASTMLLGWLRPEKPWRWTITVAVCVPIVRLAAYFLLTQKPDRAQIYESFLGFLTGIAGAYGGSVVRKGWSELYPK